ncbi:hypothetical protein ASPZODRAFT_129247 [Penicilliopsis zonata CBS 506.65]|uniref:Uncharacterized protein n=1 Tax=Penicilliopsis zonata CBS 506.65 TaxID=1073090 RepID=A0A1L9SNS8_9EURO|nr:hypothetical protein ASPZODRAFT_129247 [Penicilliopsis zonata CBS 506.65]OJJ48919.1 hypothetical protein ASPZODRAFT_129247 [Penicilliopsis zonata CBS 506.65]
MEAAPLTLAHTHARNAVLETRKSNPVAASEEHDLAAGEFATAAQNSTDLEALRTLQLLESHHKKLAQILRFQHEHPTATATEAASTGSPMLGTPPPTAEPVGVKTPAPQDAQYQHPPRLAGALRVPARETSSIASNLASARGIPAQPRRSSPASPALSSQQAGAKMTEGPSQLKMGEARLRGAQGHGGKDRTARVSTQNQPWSPPAVSPTDVTSRQIIPPNVVDSPQPKRQSSVADESFQRFYSTFEGLISKISAPLAFAGLPLGSDQASEQAASIRRKSAAETKVDRHHAVLDRSGSLAEPDVNKLFSRAALRAIRDTTGSVTGNTAESFYVVPTTGGTVSYAGILTRAEKEARRGSLDEAEDDFVDARETPASPDMRQSASSSRRRPGRGVEKMTTLQNTKTLEELQMENQALKHLSDTLSKRLHMWEVNAQSSSMALQQSLKAMHHQRAASPEQVAGYTSAPPSTTPAPAPLPSGPSSAAETDTRIKELEEIVRRGEKELDKVGRENEKLRTVLGRYRERWEKLKEGAKTRRAEGKATESKGSTAPLEPGTSDTTENSRKEYDANTAIDNAQSNQAEGDAETEEGSPGDPAVDPSMGI